MKKHSPLFLALAMMLCWHPAYADKLDPHQPTKSTSESPMEKERHTTAIEAHKMMGHIHLAALALNIDLPKEALTHIDKAEALAGRLKADAPSMTINSEFKYGKVTYQSKDTVKNYYVPIVDDIFLLSDYDAVYRHLQSIDLNETDAGIADLEVLVDLRKIEPALEAAKQDVHKKQYEKAQTALTDIFKDAMVEETVVTDPLIVVYDNLALAQNFIRTGQYASARYTLKNVRIGLAQLEKEKMASPDAQSIKTLNKEITELEKELEKNDPTLMQRVAHKFSAWGKTVKAWF